MGEGDHMPAGGHKRKFDPVHAKKIKEGGKIAKKIHEESVAQHEAEDVPKAEEDLLADLENVENNQLEKAQK